MRHTRPDIFSRSKHRPETQDDQHARMQFRTLVDADNAPGLEFLQGTACFEPGDGESLHRHQIGETAYVMSGHGIVTLDGEQNVVGPGDMVFAPAGSVHGWRAGEEPLELLYSFPVSRFEDVEYLFED
jgi:quercetin dioxygenase-like cupin family protein